METQNLDINASLRLPTSAISYGVGEKLRLLYPDRALIQGGACSFDLADFARDGHCSITPANLAIFGQWDTDWVGPGRGLSDTPQNVWFKVDWEDHSLDVVLMTWPQGYSSTSQYWIVADTDAVARKFFTAVCEHNAVLDETVLVYDGGSWYKSPELFKAIQNATFDNLILAGALKDEVRGDIARFFGSRATYEQYGVPWKRGILLLGPPGNGKTHMVKALINATGVPCLYVKSFKSQYATDHDAIRSVFHRARQTTPCVLVLEDLDSLIDDGNRSFFLNELDGFASNVGIVTIATTNHPERLDTAIVDRPSRFDRKYHFDLPAVTERKSYIGLWNEELQPELRLTAAGIHQAAECTEGFSFAYLKELFLTSLMRWINATGETPAAMDAVICEQIDLLRSQMATMNEQAGRSIDVVLSEAEEEG